MGYNVCHLNTMPIGVAYLRLTCIPCFLYAALGSGFVLEKGMRGEKAPLAPWVRAALKHHRVFWRPPQKGEGKAWGQGRMGRLCLESNKSRRLGEQGVPAGLLIDSRALDGKPTCGLESQITNCGFSDWKYLSVQYTHGEQVYSVLK